MTKAVVLETTGNISVIYMVAIVLNLRKAIEGLISYANPKASSSIVQSDDEAQETPAA